MQPRTACWEFVSATNREVLKPKHCSTTQTYEHGAVLRDISEGTSYQIVRLVFRPYTQVLPSN